MIFRKVSQDELHRYIWEGGYPGGTGKTTVGELQGYIKGKTLKHARTGGLVKAMDAYSFCSYAPSESAKTAENRLLQTCAVAQVCPFNHHGRSNLSEGADGLVYVLHD